MKIDKQYPQLKPGEFKGTYFGKYQFKEVVDGHAVYEINSPQTISFPVDMIPDSLRMISQRFRERHNAWEFFWNPDRRVKFTEKEHVRFLGELEKRFPDYHDSYIKGQTPPEPTPEYVYAQHMNLSCNQEETIYFYQLLAN
jgi:hypothetical protein